MVADQSRAIDQATDFLSNLPTQCKNLFCRAHHRRSASPSDLQRASFHLHLTVCIADVYCRIDRRRVNTRCTGALMLPCQTRPFGSWNGWQVKGSEVASLTRL